MLGAAATTALLALVWFASFHIPLVERADVSIFRGFGEAASLPRIAWFADSIARLCNEKEYLCLCALPVLFAVARRRPWLALEVAAILVGANLATQVLKQVLAHPRAEGLVPATSWPSGHTTAATALALCWVLVAPARIRPWVVGAGAAFVVAMAASLLVTDTHYPTDVISGFLVAVIWALGVAGASRVAPNAGRKPTS